MNYVVKVINDVAANKEFMKVVFQWIDFLFVFTVLIHLIRFELHLTKYHSDKKD